MKRLCTICARGGSKGVKGKNLRQLGNHSLLEISLIQAQKSKLFETITVSSDDPSILDVARKAGVDHVIERPLEMAHDSAAKLPAIQHAVQSTEIFYGAKYDICVDLDVTSPLRLVADIYGAVNLLETTRASSVITGSLARRSPYFNLVERQPDGTVQLCKHLETPIIRRQDAPPCFDMNASIYVWKRDALLNSDQLFQRDTLLFEMPFERSLDIDTEIDFEIVKWLTEKYGRFQNVW
ncbi:MAG: acylneuraminate cytidylyltransferase family protein [Bdellovibrionales bacterium]|nr:acylneuraminate cytidylyltransferase family protein [Bdellovibrionales bacterium]